MLGWISEVGVGNGGGEVEEGEEGGIGGIPPGECTDCSVVMEVDKREATVSLLELQE